MKNFEDAFEAVAPAENAVAKPGDAFFDNYMTFARDMLEVEKYRSFILLRTQDTFVTLLEKSPDVAGDIMATALHSAFVFGVLCGIEMEKNPLYA